MCNIDQRSMILVIGRRWLVILEPKLHKESPINNKTMKILGTSR